MITACSYHNFFSLGFFGFSALRFMVAVIATLSFVPAPGLSPFSEIHVRLVGAREPDPGSQLFITNEPHAIFFVFKARTIGTPRSRPRSPDRLYMRERVPAWTQPTMDGRQANTGYPDIAPDSPLPHLAIERSACAIGDGATPYP